MTQGNITPVYGIWLKEHLSLYQFHTAEAQELADNLRQLDTGEQENYPVLIDAYAIFVRMFCNSMHCLVFGVGRKEITTSHINAYLVENEYGIMTPIAFMKESKKQAQYDIDKSAFPVLEEVKALNSEIADMAEGNHNLIQACYDFSKNKGPRLKVTSTSLLLLCLSYTAIFLNWSGIRSDLQNGFMIIFWIIILALLLIFTYLTICELFFRKQWKAFFRDTLWLEERNKEISQGENPVTKQILEYSSQIAAAFAENNTQLTDEPVVNLEEKKLDIHKRRQAIQDFALIYRKKRRRNNPAGLLILGALSVFLVYGIQHWNYRDIDKLGNYIMYAANEDLYEEAGGINTDNDINETDNINTEPAYTEASPTEVEDLDVPEGTAVPEPEENGTDGDNQNVADPGADGLEDITANDASMPENTMDSGGTPDTAPNASYVDTDTAVCPLEISEYNFHAADNGIRVEFKAQSLADEQITYFSADIYMYDADGYLLNKYTGEHQIAIEPRQYFEGYGWDFYNTGEVQYIFLKLNKVTLQDGDYWEDISDSDYSEMYQYLHTEDINAGGYETEVQTGCPLQLSNYRWEAIDNGIRVYLTVENISAYEITFFSMDIYTYDVYGSYIGTYTGENYYVIGPYEMSAEYYLEYYGTGDVDSVNIEITGADSGDESLWKIKSD